MFTAVGYVARLCWITLVKWLLLLHRFYGLHDIIGKLSCTYGLNYTHQMATYILHKIFGLHHDLGNFCFAPFVWITPNIWQFMFCTITMEFTDIMAIVALLLWIAEA